MKRVKINNKILIGNMILSLFLTLFLLNCSDPDSATPDDDNQEVVDENENRNGNNENNKGNVGEHLTTSNYVRNIVNHPAFEGFGELILSRDNNSSYYNTLLSNVGSLHEGFPLAQRISELGLNAFVIRYRVGGYEATEDLARAITYIFENAGALEVNTNNYSVWGGSAGARLAGNIALNGVARYGGGNLPKPATAVIAYTGQSTYSSDFSPAFITVAANDGIANVNTVERRVENLCNAGVDVEYRRYQTAGHGFGLGTGTDAEGWLDLAVSFWKKYITK